MICKCKSVLFSAITISWRRRENNVFRYASVHYSKRRSYSSIGTSINVQREREREIRHPLCLKSRAYLVASADRKADSAQEMPPEKDNAYRSRLGREERRRRAPRANGTRRGDVVQLIRDRGKSVPRKKHDAGKRVFSPHSDIVPAQALPIIDHFVPQ